MNYRGILSVGCYGWCMRNSEVARIAVRVLAGAGPSVSRARARSTVEQLRRQSARAPKIIETMTRLTVPDVPVAVVDRESWAKAAVDSGEYIVGGAGALGPVESGMGAAVLAPRVLGQYDPFGASDAAGASGRLLLVAPNVLAYATRYALDRRDLSLWVCVHEMTHAAQHAAAPWIPGYIVSRVRYLMESKELGSHAGDEIAALMSLLEGHAQAVMNSIPVGLMPSRLRLLDTMKGKQTSGLAAHVGTLIGVDLKERQYRRGSAFVEAIVNEAGHEGLNRVWESPLNVPSLEELQAPTSWMQRVF